MSSIERPGSLMAGMQDTGMTQVELWMRYISVGGCASPAELEAYVYGALRPSDLVHDQIAQALNDHFVERGGDHPVLYADEIPERA